MTLYPNTFFQKHSTGLFLRTGAGRFVMRLGGELLFFPRTPFSAFLSRVNAPFYSFHCAEFYRCGEFRRCGGDEGAALDPQGVRPPDRVYGWQ